MILYNLTIKIDHDVHADWLEWMSDVHIPEVMATGMFREYKLSRLLGVDESDGVTYAVQYLAHSLESYQVYHERFAARLQTAHAERYQGKFVVFRSLLRVIEQGGQTEG